MTRAISPGLEAAARAMAKASRIQAIENGYVIPEGATEEGDVEDNWPMFVPMARAAIATLRDPGEGALMAAEAIIRDPSLRAEPKTKAAFKAAVKHILGEG